MSTFGRTCKLNNLGEVDCTTHRWPSILCQLDDFHFQPHYRRVYQSSIDVPCIFSPVCAHTKHESCLCRCHTASCCQPACPRSKGNGCMAAAVSRCAREDQRARILGCRCRSIIVPQRFKFQMRNPCAGRFWSHNLAKLDEVGCYVSFLINSSILIPLSESRELVNQPKGTSPSVQPTSLLTGQFPTTN